VTHVRPSKKGHGKRGGVWSWAWLKGEKDKASPSTKAETLLAFACMLNESGKLAPLLHLLIQNLLPKIFTVLPRAAVTS